MSTHQRMTTITVRSCWLACLVLQWHVSALSAQEVRYFRDSNGITWREAPRANADPNASPDLVRQPVAGEQVHGYLSYTPTIQYQWVPRWHGWWRPFREPELVYHYEPQLAWRTTPYAVRVPTSAGGTPVAGPATANPRPEQVAQVPLETIRLRAGNNLAAPTLAALPPGNRGFDPYAARGTERGFADRTPLSYRSPAYSNQVTPPLATPMGAGGFSTGGPSLAAPASPAFANRAYGGIQRMDSDPPRDRGPSRGF